MYLRPDEVARVLEKVGFEMDAITTKTYGYRRGEDYVYVNREARSVVPRWLSTRRLKSEARPSLPLPRR